MTVSLGLACVTGAVCDLAAVVRRADEALYAAKVEGRNQAKVLVVSDAEGTDAAQPPHCDCALR